MFRLVFVVLALAGAPAQAQHALSVRVLDAEADAPLPGATVAVEGWAVGAVTAADGVASVRGLPAGTYTVRISFIGYGAMRQPTAVPRADTLVVTLTREEIELHEATVTASRVSRSVSDTPTRVETIGGEEIEEKVSMDPSGLTMLLNESPGIVVQQTSGVSAAASFRIQGLDGRYTQLLRDGVPLYGGLGGGLSLLQTPPLDLAQVEIIKGPASTLYGGGAIAGLVHLVSRPPGPTPERSVLVNATSAGGADASVYAAQRTTRWGYTVLATGHLQRPYDAEDDAFTNLPAVRRLTLAPALMHYGAGTLTLRAGTMAESRDGGDVDALAGDATGFTERQASERWTASAVYVRPWHSAVLTLRTSGSRLRRALRVPGFRLSGHQTSTYSEASAVVPRGAHTVAAGVDLRTDRFDQRDGATPPLDYAHVSAGAFVQDVWDLSPAVVLETGLRLDAHSRAGAMALPRVALLLRPGPGWSVRATAGTGYSAPTPFTEEAESRAFRGVGPVPDTLATERARGASVDLHHRFALGPLVVQASQLLYATRLSRPLRAVETSDALTFETGGPVVARGAETTARVSLDDLTLFLGYVYLDATRSSASRGAPEPIPLTARHRTYSVLVWEHHGRGRVGLEAYFTGPQSLPDGSRAPGYLVGGVLAERRVGRARLFLNLENVLDARQSRTAPLVAGPREAPVFAPLWGPTDGFVANAGVVVTL